MTVEAMVSVLVAPRTGKSKPISATDLIALTRRGMPVSILTQLAATLAMDRKTIAQKIGISNRTLTRRLQPDARLTSLESDRAVRLAKVVAKSIDTFGEQAKAARWLQSPNRALDGAIPFELLDTEAGVDSVLTILGRIDYGLFS